MSQERVHQVEALRCRFNVPGRRSPAACDGLLSEGHDALAQAQQSVTVSRLDDVAWWLAAAAMCDNHTMSQAVIKTQADLGRRIAQAREDSGKTQAELAKLVGLDRSAVVRVEAGTRKVSATELVAIAAALSRPIDWFVTESPQAVVSRRQNPAAGPSRRFDLTLEHVARDVAFLVDQGILPHLGRALHAVPQTFEDAENLARSVRIEAGQPEGPVFDLQSVSERLGLLAFSLSLGSDSDDAAYVEVDTFGVALVNGTTDPGRRRFSLAHELGHHVAGDAYSIDSRLGTSDTERMINVFAAHFLMPRSAVQNTWNEFQNRSSRLAATAVSVRFRVSWTVACNQLRDLGLIDSRERNFLVENDLRKGEILELGERWVPELEPPGIPPEYASAVVNAYRERRLTLARTVELLYGTVTDSELPAIEEPTLEQLRRKLEV
jgi:Zn-dependent peptidase ImmA (M78 family)/DNA-binding XRE family transcriptional regulator